MKMKFSTYFIGSAAATIATLYYAWITRKQFYWAVVFLTTNKMTAVVLANMAVAVTLMVSRVTKTLFLGQLRDVELEIVYESSRFAITETCLALTIFREELDLRVMVLFTLLLILKIFHWLSQARVEHVEQTEGQTRSQHIRLLMLQILLLVLDASIVNTCIVLQMEQRPSVLILFAFEFVILGVAALSTLIRYLLHMIDMTMDGAWHQKSSYLFLLEFGTEVLRFFFYMVFFGIVFTYYGMPLHIVRDLWVSYSNLRRRLQAFNRYRELTANMNERFPDATQEELQGCEMTCIICRDEMTAGKRLPCGHIFHFQCLRLWLQQQQTCPTCRADIPAHIPIRPTHVPIVPLQVPEGLAVPQAAGGGQQINNPENGVNLQQQGQPGDLPQNMNEGISRTLRVPPGFENLANQMPPDHIHAPGRRDIHHVYDTSVPATGQPEVPISSPNISYYMNKHMYGEHEDYYQFSAWKVVANYAYVRQEPKNGAELVRLLAEDQTFLATNSHTELNTCAKWIHVMDGWVQVTHWTGAIIAEKLCTSPLSLPAVHIPPGYGVNSWNDKGGWLVRTEENNQRRVD